jgi:hypothetical protein
MRGRLFTLKIERDPASDTSDAEGRATVAAPSVTQYCGTFAYLSTNEAFRAQHYGQHIEAVSGAPHGTDVRHTDRIVVDEALNPCVPPEFVGTWIVEAVKYRRTRLRVLVRREDHP